MDNRALELLEEVNQRLDKVEERLGELMPRVDGEEDIPTDGSFERRMNSFVIAMNVVSAMLTYASFVYHPPLFPVFFGLFFIFLILAVGLAIDEFLLPARTFRRISTNAIAISLFWLSIIYLAVSGVGIGTSIISDPFGGVEEGRRPYSRAADEAVESQLYRESVSGKSRPADTAPSNATGTAKSDGSRSSSTTSANATNATSSGAGARQ